MKREYDFVHSMVYYFCRAAEIVPTPPGAHLHLVAGKGHFQRDVYWLEIFCTTNSSRVLARERWKTFENSWEKTQYLMNTLYKVKLSLFLSFICPSIGYALLSLFRPM